MRLISALIGCSLLLGMAACTQTSTSQDYTDFVNPFIGTGGHGHTYPGAVVPNGMIQPSPDTRIYQWDACSGYDAYCWQTGLSCYGVEKPADGLCIRFLASE